MNTCPFCGAQNPTSEKTCTECGYFLKTTAFGAFMTGMRVLGVVGLGFTVAVAALAGALLSDLLYPRPGGELSGALAGGFAAAAALYYLPPTRVATFIWTSTFGAALGFFWVEQLDAHDVSDAFLLIGGFVTAILAAGLALIPSSRWKVSWDDRKLMAVLFFASIIAGTLLRWLD